MNKLYIGSIMLLATVSYVSAEEQKPLPPQAQMMRQAIESAMPQIGTTGDTKIDEQIKALNKEMEEKIKAIRDDYLARIKAIVGTRKVMMASTTPRGMEEGKKLGRPFASSTNGTMKPPMMRGEVRGIEIENGSGLGPQIQNFLKRFLGGQKTENSRDGNDLGPDFNN